MSFLSVIWQHFTAPLDTTFNDELEALIDKARSMGHTMDVEYDASIMYEEGRYVVESVSVDMQHAMAPDEAYSVLSGMVRAQLTML